MLALLLVGSTVAWLQTFRALEYEPRAILAAQQVASLVNLSRAALIHSDAIARVSLIKTLADQEALRILEHIASQPGLVGISARFAKGRVHLRWSSG